MRGPLAGKGDIGHDIGACPGPGGSPLQQVLYYKHKKGSSKKAKQMADGSWRMRKIKQHIKNGSKLAIGKQALFGTSTTIEFSSTSK